MAMTVVGVWSCEEGNEFEVFEKPTDVVNPNPPLPPVDFTKTTLRALADQVGLKLGVAMTYNEYRQNDSVAILLKREFNTVTFGNEMKHDAIVGANGKLRFNTADEMVAYAQAAGVELFGHNLGWHSQQQTDYLDNVIKKAAADNSASLLQDNWNFEAGSLDGYTVSGFEMTESYYEVFAGKYAAKAGENASLAFNVNLEKGKPYILSFWAMSEAEGASVKASLGNQSAETAVSSTWTKYSATLKAKADGQTACVIEPAAGVCIDNIRVIETVEEEEEKAESYINPYAIDGGVDFENCTVGGDISASGFAIFNGGDYVSITDEVANSGSFSLKMDNGAGVASNAWDIQVCSPTYAIEPGKTYRIAWYGTASVDANIQIDIRLASGTQYKNSEWGQYDPMVSGKWTYQFVDVTAEEGDTELAVAFYGGTAAATYYIDDFQVFEAILEGDYKNYIAKTNLLNGADFEDANAWGIWNGSDYAEFILRNDPEIGANKDNVHSALRALKVNNIGTGYTGGDSWHIQVANNTPVDVEAGKSYRMAMWVKSPDGATTIQFHLTPDSGDTMYRQIGGITDSWTYIYMDVVIPDGVTTEQVVLDCAYDEATYYIDDVQFFPTPVESYLDPKALAGSTDFDSLTPGNDISASGWNAINGPAKVSITDETAHSGKNSLKLNNDEGTSNNWDIQALSPTFPVEAGKSYRVAFYMKTDVAFEDGGWVTIDMRAGGNTDYSHGCNPTEEWTYYCFDITPDVDDVAFAVYGGGDVAHARALYVDDFQVFPIESAQGVAAAKRGYGKYRSANWRRPAPAKAIRRASGVEAINKLDDELVDDAIGFAYKSWVYAMVEHFDVYAWDVINETFSDGGTGGFRGANDSGLQGDHKFHWGSYFGGQKEYVDMAFEYAKDALAKYGKEAVLYINDYNLEIDDAKLNALCEYAKNNENVTGVGTQMHLDMATEGLEAKIENMLNALVQTGKLVRISELDIKCTDEKAQAELYKYVFQKYMELVPEAQRGGITIWGFNDKDSWVGESNAPLLWKGNKYEKKAAYEAIYVYLCELVGIDPYQEVED